MSHPAGPDQPEDVSDTEAAENSDESEASASATPDHPDAPHDPDPVTEGIEPDPEHEPATEIMAPAPPSGGSPAAAPGERRFTAPSNFDAGTTQRMDTPVEPATEVFTTSSDPGQQSRTVAPQLIPPRGEGPKPPAQRRSWGWVVAVVLVIAALVAIAVLGTVLLTRDSGPRVSQEEMVRATIEEFDAAIQRGDLAKLRSITCGATRDSYVRYDDRTWAETHNRVAAAEQYPVVASIDQVVINGDHAEANVTTFMAYAPETRSTRSFDLQFRDDHWKICQAPQ